MPEFSTRSDVELLDDTPIPHDFPADRDELCAFFRGYATCMLWANVEWRTKSGGPPDGFDNGDVTLDEGMLRELARDVVDFIAAQHGDLVHYVEAVWRGRTTWLHGWACAGHDFALTRNGHGTGYWDRMLGDLGDRLTEASRPYGSLHIGAQVVAGAVQAYVSG